MISTVGGSPLDLSEVSYFSRLWPSTVGRAPRSTKYGDPPKRVRKWTLRKQGVPFVKQ